MNTKSGHPRGLYVLFMAEMWERFCYYGMRVLLTLYLVESLLKGDSQSALIYGAYTSLVYLAPVLGGRIADNLLGYKNAVILGGILMAIGEFLILGGTEHYLMLGMGFIIVGNGYFKANISTIVGKLYQDGDPRRDSGFTIFYIGINIGALLATTVCAEIGKTYGYHYGFALAGFGMILGILFFVLGRNRFQEKAMPPDRDKLYKKSYGPLNRFHITVVGSLLLVPILYFLIKYNNLVGYLLLVCSIVIFGGLIIKGIKDGKVLRDRMIIFTILCLLNIVFWGLFEQAGTSLTLFAKRNVNRIIAGWEMGAATTQFFNPFYIILFGSLFSMLWIKLNKIGKNPNIPIKFGLGILQLGIGYLIVLIGNEFSIEYKVPLWTLAFVYMFHTTGELFISPIGLSMVTKLAPSNMTGTLMGAWFLSFAASNYVAGLLATLTGVEEEGGGETTTVGINAAESLAQYVDIYGKFGLIAVGVGILIIIFSSLLNRLMHGIN